MLFKHNLFYGLHFSPDTGGGNGGAGASSGGDDSGGSEESGEGNPDDKPGDDDVEGLKSALAKERKERRDAAKALKDAQAELDKLRNAGKSDEEKRDADLKAAIERAEAAEKKAQKTSGQAAIFKAASDSISPEAVYALAEAKLEFDDDANPTNVDEVLAEIKKTSPKLFPTAKGSADGGKTGSVNYEPSPGVERMAYAYEQSAKKKR